MVFKKDQKHGMTLAEVLILLVIIGVVFAMTISALFTKYQKMQYVEQIKKTYTILEQTISLAEIDNGARSTWTYGTVQANGNEALAFANTYLLPYMKVSKNCGVQTGCWVSKVNKYNGTDYASWFGDITSYAKFILNDGTAIQVRTEPSGVGIHFDINGPIKGPNIYGQDIICGFHVSKNSLSLVDYIDWPRETIISDSNDGCNKTSAQPSSCLALIIKDGWKIANDYPWK